jgi:hypothetical protein
MPQSLAAFDSVLKDIQGRKNTMPISEYFKGHGSEVMKSMRKKYGARAEEVFYATANKKGMSPKARVKDSMKSVMRGRGGRKAK